MQLHQPAFDFLRCTIHNTVMSQYYRELHDRELLNQAAAILLELRNRSLVDVFLSAEDQAAGDDTAFPRRIAGVSVDGGRLAVTLDRDFFQRSTSASTLE